MTNVRTEGTSVLAASLFLLVVACVLAPMGAFVSKVFAVDTGGDSPPTPIIQTDTTSDQVAATAAEFAVDQSGAATYSIPVFTVPGTAGVVPKISISYSSQGAYGPLGKGWSIAGLSSIERCRATREAGDFIANGAPTDVTTPRPINFTSSDRFCLDGQRLIPAQATSASCPSRSGLTGQGLRTEIESFQRVCAYATAGSTTGPSFFTVERKDGSISTYGDRADAYFESTSPVANGAALVWAQTRFADSVGNYVDYYYLENPAGAGTGEHLISEIRYTGKMPISGQSALSAPFAKLMFNYSARPTAAWGRGYSAGGVLSQTRRLDSITSCASAASGCANTDQARFYQLSYISSASGSGQDTLTSVQECRDSGKAVCMAPTTFEWTQGKYEFATKEYPPNLPTGSLAKFEGFKLGDVDGDGRQDIVYLKDGSGGDACSSEFVYILFGMVNSSGTPAFTQGAAVCTPSELIYNGGPGEGSWQLFDYNGDGRDDLFVKGPDGQGWRIYKSQGRSGSMNFDTSNDLLAGLTPALTSQPGENNQPQLADVNGDGLTDVMYPRGNLLYVRLMTPQSGGGYAWGAEKQVAIDLASLPPLPTDCQSSPDTTTCTRNVAGVPTPKTSFLQMIDFNGDASSDILIRVTTTVTTKNEINPNCTILGRGTATNDVADGEEDWAVLDYDYVPEDDGSYVSIDGCTTRATYSTLNAFVVKSLTASSVGVSNYGAISTGSPYALSFADANGDGLTDVFYRDLGGTINWSYRINTGTGFQNPVSIPLSDFLDQVRFADANGDGRTDVLHPINNGSNKPYNVKYALPSGGFGPETWLQGNTTGPGNALICEGTACDNTRKAPMFFDFDGDGNLDFMSLKYDDNADLFVSRSGSNGRYAPRDVVKKVTNGLGSITTIDYAPLTNKDVYRRDSGSRDQSAQYGRGSPVLDVLMPSYVVSKAASSSPRSGDPSAMASLYYRYAGQRVQSGGRGSLGFREIVTYDPNQDTGYVATTTSYAQKFPKLGVPELTVKSAFSGQAFVAPACTASTMIDTCFAGPDLPFGAVGGQVFSSSTQVWESDSDIAGATTTAFSPGVQAPVQVRALGTEEVLTDPFANIVTGKILTSFTYGAYGNVTGSTVDTFTGTSLLSTVMTSSAYDADSPAAWRLGRLTASTITHQRPGRADVVRSSTFKYAMTGTNPSGLLLEERVQPGGGISQDLRKVYTYDDYGNRSSTSVCTSDIATCGVGIAFHPLSRQTVNRKTSVDYGFNGRYPVVTHELFWNGSSASSVDTSTVLGYDLFGNAQRVTGVNGADARMITGTFGRPYYGWMSSDPNGSFTPGTGLETVVRYRWCGTGTGQVSCPTGAKFRQATMKRGAPTQWVYSDLLARPILSVTQSFNAGVSGKDLTGSCTEYDLKGKAKRVSNPFFLAGTEGADGPSSVAGVCTSGRLWTTNTYDLLGRPIAVDAPDVGATATSLTQYYSLITGIRDANNNLTNQLRNGAGEIVQVVDAKSLAVNFSYFADGTLRSVARDAGRGSISNTYLYDVLGRKTSQQDPDTGTTTFEYNAAGELLTQINANGDRVENEIDARGRVWRHSVKKSDGTVESLSQFNFDTAAGGLGSLESETVSGTYAAFAGQSGLGLSFNRSYQYDSVGHISGTTTTIDGVSYWTLAAYDTLGRPWRVQDVSLEWAKTEFDSRGFMRAVCNSSGNDYVATCPNTADTYLTTLETDAWGHVIKERRGNSAAMDVGREYWTETGRAKRVCAGNITTCNLMDEGYGWDEVGNLSTQRKENRYLEGFTYDALNRVNEARLLMQNGVTTNTLVQQFQYDQLGNVCRRFEQGVGDDSFQYAGRSGCGLGGSNSTYGGGTTSLQSPHQVSETDRASTSLSNFYYYDVKGNQTSRAASGSSTNRAILYSLDDHAIDIGGSGIRTRFWYGSDGQRYKREDGTKRTIYLGNVEIVINGAQTTTKRTVAGVLLQTIVGTTKTNQYLFHDHLGSLARITSASGGVINTQDYAAFGDRRNPTNQSPGGTVPSLTTRGFTGQEHVDGLEVIHMNGRIYDQTLGRFLQADAVIQAPNNGQSWNAYTYVFNNPLAYTDPTGMIGTKERQWLAVIIAIVGAVTSQYYISVSAYGSAFAVAVASGFAAGAIAAGTLKGGLIGAFSAALTFGAGYYFDGWQQVAAQATSGGITESLQGGNFGNGFFAAGISAAFMPQLGKNVGNVGARALIGALVGGTISEVTGGKFSNGAISGAIQGAMAGHGEDTIGQDEFSEPGDPRLALESAIAAQSALTEAGAFRIDGFATEHEAADAFGAAVVPLNLKAEVGSLISEYKSRYFLGDAYSDGARTHVSGLIYNGRRAPGIVTAFTHTHPDVPNLSGGGYGFKAGRSLGKAIAWDHSGDMRTAYTQQMSAYSYSANGSDYFSLSNYAKLQRQSTDFVPLCRAATLGCR